VHGLRYFFITIVFAFGQLSVSLEPVRFGPEFTFMWDKTFWPGDLILEMQEHLVHEQPDGIKFTADMGYQDRNRWISPDGWWTAVYRDSGGFEVNVSPMTVADYKRFAGDLKDAIFVSAANIGYFPRLWQGGGHINIDLAVFENRPLLFRNFLVDLLNHNELFMGIFNYDYFNARPPQVAFEALSEAKKGLGLEPSADFETYLHRVLPMIDEYIFKQPSSNQYLGMEYATHLGPPIGSSFGIKGHDQSRLEIRAVRPQTSIDMFIRQIELLEGRLKYLESFTEPIAYKQVVPLNPDIQESIEVDKLTPPIAAQDALRAFYQYVNESGQRWQNHRDYLWPQWMSGGEVEKFESSGWFKAREGSCADLLRKS
jgi:hypothetical protein